jgi:hypothetical protein
MALTTLNRECNNHIDLMKIVDEGCRNYGKTHGLVTNIYFGKANVQIYQSLYDSCKMLVANEFRGNIGLAHGMGKTTAIKHFVNFCQIVSQIVFLFILHLN